MNSVLRRLHKATKLFGVPIYRGAMAAGAAAAIEHADVLRSLDCRLVVDVGANKGQFALVARHSFPSARIVSFEPLSGPAAIFRRVFSGDRNVELHQMAIGANKGEQTIHISAREDSSSLLPITDLQNEIFPGTAERSGEPIQVAPLTDFLRPKDVGSAALLKIDVQGFELAVLEGCGALLDAFCYVYVECSFQELYAGQAFADDVVGHLRAHGFSLTGVYNLANDARGLAVQGDFLFVRAR